MLKQTLIVHSNKLIVQPKILYETNAFFSPSTPCHKTTQSCHVVPALPSRLRTVCFCLVVHRTARSAMHGSWFSVQVCFFFFVCGPNTRPQVPSANRRQGTRARALASRRKTTGLDTEAEGCDDAIVATFRQNSLQESPPRTSTFWPRFRSLRPAGCLARLHGDLAFPVVKLRQDSLARPSEQIVKRIEFNDLQSLRCSFRDLGIVVFSRYRVVDVGETAAFSHPR